jgi:hypothetical protein
VTTKIPPKIPPKLKAKWDKILANDGLGEIDVAHTGSKTGIADPYRLRGNAENNYDQLKPKTLNAFNKVRIEAIEEYYYRASQFFNQYQFFSKRERSIYALNITGLSIRDIEKILKKRQWRYCGRDLIHKTIKRLDKIMLTDNWDIRPIKKKRCKTLRK